MADSNKFERLSNTNFDKIPIKPFTTSQLPSAKNHCGAVALANVLLMNNLIESDQDSLEVVYSRVGNGPVVLLSKTIRLYYNMLQYRYIRPSKIASSDFESTYYLVCMPLTVFEWHWFVVIDIIHKDKNAYYVVLDGWNNSVRYLNMKKMKYGFALKINKALNE